MKNVLIINNEKFESDSGWISDLKSSLLELESLNFNVVHHSKISHDIIKQYNPDCVICYGRVSLHWTMEEILQDYKKELEYLKNPIKPTLAICAGLQLAAIAHSVTVDKMVENSEIDILEEGFVALEVIQTDPILEGLNDNFICYEIHRDEAKAVPKGFELLASNETCKVQMIKKSDYPLYCTQFHPEKFNEKFQDGKLLLRNFLSISS